jgi:hypothetical protein
LAAILPAGLMVFSTAPWLNADAPHGIALPEPALAVAWLGSSRLVVLSASSVALYRWSSDGAERKAGATLPARAGRVRRPGGMIAASPAESSFWAMTSLSRGATLFAVDGDRMIAREEAAAIPWPGSQAGLRYRDGTNLLEATLDGLGDGPYLAVGGAAGAVQAVSAEGRLLKPGADPGPRVGWGLAALWPGLVAVSAPDPRGGADAVLLLRLDAPGPPLATFPLPAPVRALAAHVDGNDALLAAATVGPDGAARLVVLDLTRPAP